MIASAALAEPTLVADARATKATPATSTTPAKPNSGCRQEGRATSAIPEVALINDAIRKGWTDHNLVPSKAATDGEWCRRVYLDLIGRVPTVEELSAYLAEQEARQAGDSSSIGCWATSTATSTCGTGRRSGRTCSSAARAAPSGRSLVDRDGHAAVSQRGARVQQAVRRDGAGADHGDGQLPAGRRGLQRGGEFPGRQDGGERRAGDGQDVADLPGHGGAVHAVPQPSVQRVQAEPVLGAERVLPADARWSACAIGDKRRDDYGRVDEPRFPRRGRQRRTRPRFSTSCATAS